MRIQAFLEEDRGAFSSTRLALMIWIVGVRQGDINISVSDRLLGQLRDSKLT